MRSRPTGKSWRVTPIALDGFFAPPLSHAGSMPLPENLARFEVPRPVREVIERLQREGHAALLVGGCVRDILLDVPPKDFDVATSARPATLHSHRDVE